MPEHRIRLRGGWECMSREQGEDGPETARRLALPAPTPGDLPRKCRLTRQFGRPPVDPGAQVVILELRCVAGLRSARLNGRPIEIGPGEDGLIRVPIVEPLLPRNGLVLEVDRGDAPAEAGPWGEIALVIRARRPGG